LHEVADGRVAQVDTQGEVPAPDRGRWRLPALRHPAGRDDVVSGGLIFAIVWAVAVIWYIVAIDSKRAWRKRK